MTLTTKKMPKKPQKPKTRKPKATEPVVTTTVSPPVLEKPKAIGYPLVKPIDPFIKTKTVVGSNFVPLIAAILLIGGVGYTFKDKIDTYVSQYRQKLTVVSETPKVEAQISVPKKENNELIKVLEIRKFYLRAERADGKIELRTGGSSNWRYHNPGKIIHGDFTRMMGALGSDGEVAVFPSLEKGRKAIETYLFTDVSTYQDMTMEEAFKSNKLSVLLKETGVTKQTLLKDLSADQRKRLLDAIQKAEGWIEGKIQTFADKADWETNGY